MITVSIFSCERGCIEGFQFEGHADVDEYGYDIVCSAVSALAIGCANSIEKLTNAGFEEDAAEDGGYLKVILKPETAADHDAQLLLKSMVLAVSQMAESYPENLRIRHIERKNYGRE
jgi:uncharacterized protein YsxB (DUF464 family)